MAPPGAAAVGFAAAGCDFAFPAGDCIMVEAAPPLFGSFGAEYFSASLLSAELSISSKKKEEKKNSARQLV